ncbi:MAG: hypothetical protein HYZ13_13455 [Acidobacteria bacterium]|nr:hypothetical protein [Acidobacteriota bacterium]
MIPLASKADVLRPIFNWFYAPQVRDWLTYLGFPADKPVNVLEGSARTFLYEWYVVPLEKDRALKAELQTMAKATEGMEPHARARALVRALRGKVRTLAEFQDVPDRRSYEADPLKVLRRGWGTSYQLNHLGFLLLRESGLEVTLVSAIDREENKLMDPSNIFQYDQNLLGVKDAKGQWLYLNPGSTFEPFGVSPWLQGGRALQVIPAAKRLEWGASFTTIPLAESASNTQVWTATVTPGAEADAYSVGFEATGSMAARWKRKLHDQQAPELKKGLGLILERGRFQLQRAEGEGALDPWSGFKVSFDGNLEHDGGRRRVVPPFPFLQSPFAIPATWPEQRTVGIHLPMACRIQAETRMAWAGGELPGGGLEPLERENIFGKVSWTAALEEVQGAKVLVARLRIEIQRPLGSPMYYEQLKAFSGWVQEALGRGLPVPRP